MLSQEQSGCLERWALCEQLLQGRVRIANLEGSNRLPGLPSPISDNHIDFVNEHMRQRKRLVAAPLTLIVLASFTSIQNQEEAALPPAYWGLKLFPTSTNKADAFLWAIGDASKVLVQIGY